MAHAQPVEREGRIGQKSLSDIRDAGDMQKAKICGASGGILNTLAYAHEYRVSGK